MLSTGLKLEEFDENEPMCDWPFCGLVGCLIWLAKETRPGVANAERAVARYANKPREVHGLYFHMRCFYQWFRHYVPEG